MSRYEADLPVSVIFFISRASLVLFGWTVLQKKSKSGHL